MLRMMVTQVDKSESKEAYINKRKDVGEEGFGFVHVCYGLWFGHNKID